MSAIGEKFKINEVFVPEMLIAARAMKECMIILEPLLADAGIKPKFTAMVLAEQKMIPRVFAAVVRAVTAVRSLVAYKCGAVGPGKDCGYENPILKAITGFPMAMADSSKFLPAEYGL